MAPNTHAHTSMGDNFSLVQDLDAELHNELCALATIEAQPSLVAAFKGPGDEFDSSKCEGEGYKRWMTAIGFQVICNMAVRHLTGPVRGLPTHSIRDGPCAAVASTSRFGCLQKVNTSGRRLLMTKASAWAIINGCIAKGEQDQVARWAQAEFARRGKALSTERAGLGKLLASDDLSEPARAETQ